MKINKGCKEGRREGVNAETHKQTVQGGEQDKTADGEALREKKEERPAGKRERTARSQGRGENRQTKAERATNTDEYIQDERTGVEE